MTASHLAEIPENRLFLRRFRTLLAWERHLHPSRGMDTSFLRQQLNDLAFSSVLPSAVLEEIAAISSLVDFPTGSILFQEGSENHSLYLICRGSVALEMSVPERGLVRVLTLAGGDMVAWSAMLGRGEMSTTAVAVEDTHVIAISALKLLAICESNPEAGFQIMRRMAQALSRRLVATRLQLLDLFSDEATVAH